MLWSTLLVASSAFNAAVYAAPTGQAGGHVVDLERVKSSPTSSKSLLYNRAINSTRLSSVENSAGYGVPITFGGQKFVVLFDTGSSDLWVPASSFQCVDIQGEDATGQCGLGHRFQGTFSGGSIPNQNFNISYGDGSSLLGTLGYEAVSLAGVTVPRQEAALVTSGYWTSDGDTSGLMGFAYPLLTSAFTGTNPAADSLATNQAAYNPFFFNAINQKLVEPVFTLSLGRGTNAGQLSLGGVPASAANMQFASTPLEKFQINPAITGSAKKFSFYTINPDSFTLAGQTATAQKPMIVDSGTTLSYFPNDLAIAINQAFDPPSIYIEEEGVFENYCNATPPAFSVRIGGTDFTMSAQDLLLTGDNGYDSYTEGCLTGIQPGGKQGPFILGETFLRNVVTVFDVGGSKMSFAQK